VTEKEYYDRFLADRYPKMTRDYNESEGYYYHDMAQFGYRSFKYRAGLRPTAKGKISKEQLAVLKADTTDIVNNLRGIYPGAVAQYPVIPLQTKAADLIEGLQEENKALKAEILELIADMPEPADS
jgi:hypothetical protein